MTDPSKGQIGPGAYIGGMADKRQNPLYTMGSKLNDQGQKEKIGFPSPS